MPSLVGRVGISDVVKSVPEWLVVCLPISHILNRPNATVIIVVWDVDPEHFFIYILLLGRPRRAYILPKVLLPAGLCTPMLPADAAHLFCASNLVAVRPSEPEESLQSVLLGDIEGCICDRWKNHEEQKHEND